MKTNTLLDIDNCSTTIGSKIVKNKIYTYNVIRRRKGGMISYVENCNYL